MFLCWGESDLSMHSRLTRGVRPRLEGKQRTPLSSQVLMGISWSPLSGLKAVKPPVMFGERTRDCSLGHAGKEGPQLVITGACRGFLRLGASVEFLTRYDGELREPLVWHQGSQVSILVAKGST